MSEYQLCCFAQSGHCYRAALMLNLIGADWEPLLVDFFVKAVQRTPQYRSEINEMGEAPVLVHGSRRLSQSGVILSYLAERSGRFLPRDDDAKFEALRWLLFDNQKVNGFLGPYRFLRSFAKPQVIPPCWNSSRAASKTRSVSSTSDWPTARTCLEKNQASQMCR